MTTKNPNKSDFTAQPIVPDKVLLAHGGGGSLMHQLIGDLFTPTMVEPEFDCKHDGAVFEIGGKKVAFTTDSFVVHPLFFPGGDIGTLAVWGTVNDLAMCGARPLFLSVGFIIEEGLEIQILRQIVRSMRVAADRIGIKIVTGDTKVVDRGKGHGIFINTAGVGLLEHDLDITPDRIAVNDAIILNGNIGKHGIAVMAEREGLSFRSRIESDLAPLADPVLELIGASIEVHCLRDLTRGGLATALVELARASGQALQIEELSIPLDEQVKNACEILGFDPLYVANEGRFVAFVPADAAVKALSVLRATHNESCVIGKVTGDGSALVTMKTSLGTERIIDMLSGEQLPRIC